MFNKSYYEIIKYEPDLVTYKDTYTLVKTKYITYSFFNQKEVQFFDFVIDSTYQWLYFPSLTPVDRKQKKLLHTALILYKKQNRKNLKKNLLIFNKKEDLAKEIISIFYPLSSNLIKENYLNQFLNYFTKKEVVKIYYYLHEKIVLWPVHQLGYPDNYLVDIPDEIKIENHRKRLKKIKEDPLYYLKYYPNPYLLNHLEKTFRFNYIYHEDFSFWIPKTLFPILKKIND